MRRGFVYAMLITLPLLLLVVAWQAGRFDSLASEARRLEASQETWVQENRKLEAGIRVLSSRERADALAQGLGFEKAGPERRVRIVVQPQAQAQGTRHE